MDHKIDDNQNFDDFDYEKIQQILEEEEKNRRIRKEQESRKEKDRTRDRKDKDGRDNRDVRYNEKDKNKYRDKSISIEKKRDYYRNKNSRSNSRSRHQKKSRRDSRDNSRSNKRSRSRSRNRKTREDTHREKIYVEKTIEEAKKQALEAQRDDCTILVYRLHLDAKERDLFNFFAAANIGKIIDIKVIRDPRTGKSKGVAYVEFESHESVLLAVAMSGQQISGQSIVIQHSQAEKNRQAAAAKYKKEMIKEQHRVNSKKPLELPEVSEGPMKIYVGGLIDHLLDVSDNDLRNIFNSFGEIESIDMPKDPGTFKSRGYCFIQFRKSSQAQGAITAMNGFKFKGKILKVGVAHEGNKNNLDHGDLDEENLHSMQSKQVIMQKLNRDVGIGMSGIGFPSLPSMTTPNPIGIPQISNYRSAADMNIHIQSACLLLSNLFDPTQVNLKEDANFYLETKQDVFEECSNFGKVEGVWVDQNSQGNVWVKFSQNNWQAARAALEQLNGRWFASRPIIAQLIPDNLFEDNIKYLK